MPGLGATRRLDGASLPGDGWVVGYVCVCLSICPSACVCVWLWMEGGGVGSENNRNLFLAQTVRLADSDKALHSPLLLEVELLQRASLGGKVDRQDVVRVVIIKELGRVRGSIQKGGENGYQGK